jgi:hypothetical protein
LGLPRPRCAVDGGGRVPLLVKRADAARRVEGEATSAAAVTLTAASYDSPCCWCWWMWRRARAFSSGVREWPCTPLQLALTLSRSCASCSLLSPGHERTPARHKHITHQERVSTGQDVSQRQQGQPHQPQPGRPCVARAFRRGGPAQQPRALVSVSFYLVEGVWKSGHASVSV